MPTVSTLNAYDGAVTSNMAIVPAGEGNNSINAFAGTEGRNYTSLILDISSYFAPVPLLTVENTSLPDATLDSGYSVSLAATGGVPPYAWSRSGGGLPPGLNISPSGTIAGTPTSTGTFTFGAEVTDSETPAQASVRNLQITVDSSQGTLNITTASLPNATVNTLFPQCSPPTEGSRPTRGM